MSRAPHLASRSQRRGIILLADAVLAAGGGAWWWNQHRTVTAGSGSGYRTATVDRGDIRVDISSTGSLSAISTVVVGTEISGKVTDVLVDFNDHVRKGQVLARIDPSTYQAQIAQGNDSIGAATAIAAEAAVALRNAEVDYRCKDELGK